MTLRMGPSEMSFLELERSESPKVVLGAEGFWEGMTLPMEEYGEVFCILMRSP